MYGKDNIYTFETKNFRVSVDALPEDEWDLSWDESGDAQDGLDSGRYVGFCAHASVTYKPTGEVLGDDYLGQCIYESLADFRTSSGTFKGYFGDMVRQAVAYARDYLAALQAVERQGESK